jgi:transposase
MAKYKPYNYAQSTMVAVNLSDQLMPGTLEYAIHHLIESRIDLSIFNERYKNDDTGSPAYDPKVLLKIVLLGYSRGLTSSRKIERACRENILFMSLACGQCPDHTTIATFVSSMHDEILPIYRNILLVCDQEKLLGGTRFAIDGCKLPGNASKNWSGTFAELEHKKARMEEKVRQILDEHQTEDGYGDDFGQTSQAQTKLKKLQKNIEKLQNWLETHEPKPGKKQKETKSNVTDNDTVQMVTSHGTIQGYNAQVLVDSKHQIIMHADAVANGEDSENLPPLLDGAKENITAIGRPDDHFENTQLLGDAKYHGEVNLKKCFEENLDSYIPDNNFRKRDPQLTDDPKFSPADFTPDPNGKTYICPAGKPMRCKQRQMKKGQGVYSLFVARKEDCGRCAFRKRCLGSEKSQARYLYIFYDNDTAHVANQMYEKFATTKGRAVYSNRIGTIEPVFANIRHQKALNRFTLRGKSKVNIQWLLYCMVHNIEKILNYGSEQAFCPA